LPFDDRPFEVRDAETISLNSRKKYRSYLYPGSSTYWLVGKSCGEKREVFLVDRHKCCSLLICLMVSLPADFGCLVGLKSSGAS